VPPLPSFPGGLWLGATYRALLLSRVDVTGPQMRLSYDDCDRFDPRRCPPPVDIVVEPACRIGSFRGLTDNAYRFLRRHGAIAAFYGRNAGLRVLSGEAVTNIQLARGNRLRALEGILRSLRSLAAGEAARRLAPPRVPESLARRLESTARAYSRHRNIGRTARVLGIRRAQLVSRLRLRKALRSFGPYRISSCG
jgi:hypothetical protein